MELSEMPDPLWPTAAKATPMFRKRLKYAFGKEWRIIRLLRRLERCPGNVFLSMFDPASVREIFIGNDCAADKELRQLVETDSRYRHVPIRMRS